MSEQYEDKLREIDKRNEEKIQEFARNMMNRMPFFIAVGIAIFWVFYGTVEIYPTSLSVTDRIMVTLCTECYEKTDMEHFSKLCSLREDS